MSREEEEQRTANEKRFIGASLAVAGLCANDQHDPQGDDDDERRASSPPLQPKPQPRPHALRSPLPPAMPPAPSSPRGPPAPAGPWLVISALLLCLFLLSERGLPRPPAQGRLRAAGALPAVRRATTALLERGVRFDSAPCALRRPSFATQHVCALAARPEDGHLLHEHCRVLGLPFRGVVEHLRGSAQGASAGPVVHLRRELLVGLVLQQRIGTRLATRTLRAKASDDAPRLRLPPLCALPAPRPARVGAAKRGGDVSSAPAEDVLQLTPLRHSLQREPRCARAALHESRWHIFKEETVLVAAGQVVTGEALQGRARGDKARGDQGRPHRDETPALRGAHGGV